MLGVLCAQYFAGFLFLKWFRLDPQHATPLTVLRYAYYYGERADVRERLWTSSAVGFALVVMPGLIALLPKPRSLHGDARFARRSEIARAGLLTGEGIILGKVGGFFGLGGRYLRLSGQQGVSLSAQPRAGKGVSTVIPNLLTWRGSTVVTDIKRENWTLTAGYRASQGQTTILFDPLSPSGRTYRWNPLDYASKNPNQRISDIQLIAGFFFPEPVGSDPFWMSSARSLFLGIALYLFSTPGMPCTIGEILRQGMANDEEGFAAHWKRVIQGRMSGRHPLPDTCVRALYDVIDLAPQTASSIRKTFTSKLELWLNPVLDAATAASDFDLRELRKKPMSIYLAVMPKDLERLAPLMSLFFQQAIALQTDELPEHNPALKFQVLMLLDEFPALGFIPIIAKASGFLPGYNVRTLMIMQAPSQLRQVYGQDGAKTLLKTLAARIFFAAKDMEDAQEISGELGFTTVKAKAVSRPMFGSFGGSKHRHWSVNISAQKRALMLPQEIKTLGARRQIVFTENTSPILCRKIRYYTTSFFRKRLLEPPLVEPIQPIKPTPRASREKGPGASPGAAATPAVREATAADIDRIDSLTLDDFSADFSKVQIPEKAEGERLTERELQVAVESFLSTLREQ